MGLQKFFSSSLWLRVLFFSSISYSPFLERLVRPRYSSLYNSFISFLECNNCFSLCFTFGKDYPRYKFAILMRSSFIIDSANCNSPLARAINENFRALHIISSARESEELLFSLFFFGNGKRCCSELTISKLILEEMFMRFSLLFHLLEY